MAEQVRWAAQPLSQYVQVFASYRLQSNFYGGLRQTQVQFDLRRLTNRELRILLIARSSTPGRGPWAEDPRWGPEEDAWDVDETILPVLSPPPYERLLRDGVLPTVRHGSAVVEVSVYVWPKDREEFTQVGNLSLPIK